MTRPKIASELTISNSESELSSSQLASKGVVLNFSLRKLKALSYSSAHLKPTFFLMHSVNGAAKVENSE